MSDFKDAADAKAWLESRVRPSLDSLHSCRIEWIGGAAINTTEPKLNMVELSSSAKDSTLSLVRQHIIVVRDWVLRNNGASIPHAPREFKDREEAQSAFSEWCAYLDGHVRREHGSSGDTATQGEDSQSARRNPASRAAAAEFLQLVAGKWHLRFSKGGERTGEERCQIDSAGGYYLIDRQPGRLWCSIEDVQYDPLTRSAAFTKVKRRGTDWRRTETVVLLPGYHRMEGHDDRGQSVVYERLVGEKATCSGDSVSVRDKVFISYSHKDRRFLEQLLTHLRPLERAGRITHWSDEQIQPGSEWLEQIEDALASSKVAVLLVTKDFLASDFIHDHEFTPLLKDAEQGGARILWFLVRACAYEETPLRRYQAVISPDRPLAVMKAERDGAWVEICREIHKAANA